MRRVYLAYAVRTVFSQRAVRFIPFALVFIELTPFLPFVSLNHIISNMPNITNLKSLYSYQVSAFMNTELVVQVSFAALVIVLVSYVYSVISSIFSQNHFLNGKIAG